MMESSDGAEMLVEPYYMSLKDTLERPITNEDLYSILEPLRANPARGNICVRNSWFRIEMMKQWRDMMLMPYGCSIFRAHPNYRMSPHVDSPSRPDWGRVTWAYEEVSPGIYEPWQPDEEESSIMSYWDVSEADEVTTDMCNITGDPTRDLTYVIPREKRLPGWRGNLKEELSFQMSYPGLINVGQPHSVWHTSDKPRIAISIEFMNRKGVFEPFSKLTKTLQRFGYADLERDDATKKYGSRLENQFTCLYNKETNEAVPETVFNFEELKEKLFPNATDNRRAMEWEEAEQIYLSERLLEKGAPPGKLLADQGLGYDDFLEKKDVGFRYVIGNVVQSLMNVDEEYYRKYPK